MRVIHMLLITMLAVSLLSIGGRRLLAAATKRQSLCDPGLGSERCQGSED